MTSVARRADIVLVAVFPLVAIGLINGIYEDDLARKSPAWFWIADITHYVVLPTLGLLVLHYLGRYRPVDYGFKRFLKGENLASAGGLVLFVTFVYWVAYDPIKSIAYRFFWQTSLDASFISVIPTYQPLRFLTVFYISLSAAFVEEPVFRSLPWLYFSSTLSSPLIPYIVSATLLFAAVHWEHGLPNVIATASLGLAASVLYVKILNIWPFVIAHFLVGAWTYKWW